MCILCITGSNMLLLIHRSSDVLHQVCSSIRLNIYYIYYTAPHISTTISTV